MIDSEWAAVALFYAAYHSMRAVFADDPIFDDPHRLSQASAHLTMEDRYVSHHQGRAGSNVRFGVSDIVARLYRPVAGKYDRLHQCSIDVRYGPGLRAPLDTVFGYWRELEPQFSAGLVSAE